MRKTTGKYNNGKSKMANLVSKVWAVKFEGFSSDIQQLRYRPYINLYN